MKIVDTNQYNIDEHKLLPCDHFLIEGKKYHTKEQAMTALNISLDVLKLRCRSNAFPNWQRFDRYTGAIKQKTHSKVSRQTYIFYIDGKEMSVFELMAKYKIRDNCVRNRCRSPNYPGWVMKDSLTQKIVQKRLEGRSKNGNRKKVMADNRVFDSMKIAARTLKICTHTLRKRCRNNWTGYKFYE